MAQIEFVIPGAGKCHFERSEKSCCLMPPIKAGSLLATLVRDDSSCARNDKLRHYPRTPLQWPKIPGHLRDLWLYNSKRYLSKLIHPLVCRPARILFNFKGGFCVGRDLSRRDTQRPAEATHRMWGMPRKDRLSGAAGPTGNYASFLRGGTLASTQLIVKRQP